MPLSLSKQLIECPSITPDDAGCQKLIAEHLSALGFTIEPMKAGDVDNLWATIGSGEKTFCFAGHTDVVPPGPLELWPYPPFSPTIENNYLYGRGAADMKTAIAAMIVAVNRFLKNTSLNFRLAFLITSDEEGPAINGTKAILEKLNKRSEIIDYCLVGEPSSDKHAGDTIKPGRRGSLHATVMLKGKQGHVAYPEQCQNPIHAAGDIINELHKTQWDSGNAFFLPTSFQVTKIESDSGAENVVPEQCLLRMNWRFSPESTPKKLLAELERILVSSGINDYHIEHRCSAEPFYTPKDSPFLSACITAIKNCTGQEPAISTAGGTSDGRFFAPMGTHVVECGVPNATIHQIGENVAVDDITLLSNIYEAILRELNEVNA